MRWMGFAAIAISVLLGTGGVRYTHAADPAKAEVGECTDKAPEMVQKEAAARAKATKSKVIVLNTRGHNYRRPGEQEPTKVKPVYRPAPEGEAPSATPKPR